MKNKYIERLVLILIALILYTTIVYLIFKWYDYKLALILFLLIWANNIERQKWLD